MTNAQALAIMSKIMRAAPEHQAALEEIENYIGDLVYVAGLARENLNLATQQLKSDDIIQHNAGIVDTKLDSLLFSA